ncbi:MAG: alpha/beta hydrolase, partial [Cyanobacteria bacterium J06659_2]
AVCLPSNLPMRQTDGQLESHTDNPADSLLTHRYVRIEKTLRGVSTDVTFHYVESTGGGRECIVFLHGFMDTWKLWRYSLHALAQTYRVVAFDLKGCGQSSMNYPQGLFPSIDDPGGNYQLSQQADEIVAAIHAIGIQRFNLVTLDLGTIIGDLLAGRYGDRIIRYIRCQQPLVGHFRSAIPQGQLLRRKRSAKWLTRLLEVDASSLLRVLYGKTGWPILDRHMKRTLHPMPDATLESAVGEASYTFQTGPRKGNPGTFLCAWAGLYQHNQDYRQFIQRNLDAYQAYAFPIFVFQGKHDIAMPPERFDGTTGMAFKVTRSLKGDPTLLSRSFDKTGAGLGDGYQPWGDFIPGCQKPMPVEAFFPHSPSVTLVFFETGHFIPIENPELFTAHLAKALKTP